MTDIRSGGCQCGAVRFHAARLLDNPHICHCRMCQKAVGGFFAALVGVPHDALTWSRGAPAEFESSTGVFRGFCRECGTPLYFRRAGGGHVSLTIGSFDAPASIPLVFEFGVEGRMPQLDQIGHLPAHATEEEDPDDAARIRATSRQHPDRDTPNGPA